MGNIRIEEDLLTLNLDEGILDDFNTQWIVHESNIGTPDGFIRPFLYLNLGSTFCLRQSDLSNNPYSMDHKEVGEYWNENAEVWTKLSRSGFDIYRDGFNTPAFMEMLPDVDGLCGLDIGCGEGHNTRLVAQAGARMSGIDIAETFIEYACEAEDDEPLEIQYHHGSAVEMPFSDNTFDFATAFMSFMDIPETDLAVAEAYRVIKPGGFFQYSILHPCFETPHREKCRDEDGRTYAIEVGDYFRNMNGEVQEWHFSMTPEEMRKEIPKFKVPRFTHTMSRWINLLIDTGFAIERMEEPIPSDEAVNTWPALQDAQVYAQFLHFRVRK